MKYRNKNYIETGILPFILLPVVAATIGLTLCISDAFRNKPSDLYPLPRTDLIAAREELLADTPEFKAGDEALFNFTGDTVLVLSQPDSLAEFDEEVRVIHKTAQGSMETIDLPENWLVKLQTDTLPVKKPVVQADDKLLFYKRR